MKKQPKITIHDEETGEETTYVLTDNPIFRITRAVSEWCGLNRLPWPQYLALCGLVYGPQKWRSQRRNLVVRKGIDGLIKKGLVGRDGDLVGILDIPKTKSLFALVEAYLRYGVQDSSETM